MPDLSTPASVPAPAPASIVFRGIPAERHDTLPSTNEEALRRAEEGAPAGLVVTARHQPAGRGRRGRSWWDKPGASVLASLLLRPALPLRRYPLLGMAMACAVADAAERLAPGERFDVKWPNDVLHKGRKVCGVLAETRVSDGTATGMPPLVIGFGINVNQDQEAWPEEVRPTAGSLRIAAGGRDLDTEAVLREVLRRFDPYLAYADHGDADALWIAVRARLPRDGAAVSVAMPEGTIGGVIEGFSGSGAIRVRDASGRLHTLSAGEIPFTGEVPGT